MKNIFFVLFIILSKNIIAQTDSLINIKPVNYAFAYTGDVIKNNFGGLNNGTNYLGLLNLKLLVNTEKANLWKGGELFINVANTHGKTPSADLTGDFQGISNIEAGNYFYLHESWYKHIFGNFTGIIGVQDINVELISSEYSSIFLNGSFGPHSTIADNVPSPVFPLTSFGLQFQYQFSDKLNAKLLILDGFPDNFEKNPHNLVWHLNLDDGILSFFEFTISHSFVKNLNGKYKIGGYSHNHFKNYEYDNDVNSLSNNFGFYFVGDQCIYNKNKKNLAFFTQASISPYELNENWYYLGFGISYSGMLSSKFENTIGLAIAHAGFKNRTNESALEFTLKLQINNIFYIQPDIQYIINPSGTELSLKNAFTTNLRIGINI